MADPNDTLDAPLFDNPHYPLHLPRVRSKFYMPENPEDAGSESTNLYTFLRAPHFTSFAGFGHKFRACTMLPGKHDISPDGFTLKVPGYRLDHVVLASEPLPPPHIAVKDNAITIRMSEISVEAAMHFHGCPEAPKTKEEAREITWRTLVADQYLENGFRRDEVRHHPAPDHVAHGYEVLMRRQEVPEESYKSTIESFLFMYNIVASEHKFFITAKGRVGIGPWKMKSGDQIYMVHGWAMPVVLRQAPGNFYIVVGDAYVHGVMGGETVPRFLTGEFKEEQLQLAIFREVPFHH